VGDHRHAEGAGGADRRSAGGQKLSDALDVHLLPVVFFHPHPAAAGAATERLLADAGTLAGSLAGCFEHHLAWLIVELVVTAEITRIVIDDVGAGGGELELAR